MRARATVRGTRLLAVWIGVVIAAAVLSSMRYAPAHVATRARTAPAAPSATTHVPLTATTATTSTTTTTEVPTTVAETPSTAPSAPPEATAPGPADGLAIPSLVDPGPQSAGPLPLPLPQPTGGWGVDAYRGLGTWIDVYDWTAAYGGAQISIADIDQMASYGVQTLYVQPVRWDVDTALMETDRLLPLLQRARADGMRVIAWYLPDLQDIDRDLRHLDAIASQLPIDGLAIDIESRSVEDVGLRNAQLMALSDALRSRHPGQALGAIVLPPVVIDQINPNYWPGYPWTDLARDYDVWLPMAYYTNRTGYWRDAYRYISANVSDVRAHLSQPGAVVHAIGGIGDETTVDDISGMATACQEQACFGASVYDYRTTQDPNVWAALGAFRR